MTYPTKPEALAMLKKWQRHHDATEKMMDGIKATIGIDGPLFDCVWAMFYAYTESLCVALGDGLNGWLPWFYMENDMGRSGLSAGHDGKTKPIKTVNQLYALIVKGRKR